MNDFKFPDPPGPQDLSWYRRVPPMYYWWGGTVVFLGLTIIWLPSQCVLNDLEVPERGNPEENAYKNLNQEKDLEFREDGLWYEIKSESPFTGFADAYHPNGKIRSRTNEPVSIPAMAGPRYETTGSKAPRNPCLRTTVRGLRPLA